MPRIELPGLLGELVNVGRKTETPRGTVAEWTVTILLLLFGTTTLVQAFVIPTGSMEDTLLIGDHLLVRSVKVTGRPMPRDHGRIRSSTSFVRFAAGFSTGSPE